MRVLLVFLNFDCPVGLSHGLAVLGRELREAGHQVSLLHVSEVVGLPFEPYRIAALAAGFRPDAVGLSFGTNHAWAARVLVARLRERLPEVLILCGGIHATVAPGEVMAWEGVDAVALGEVDDGRLTSFLEDWEAGRVEADRPGFWVRRRGRILRGPMAPPVDLSRGSHRMDLTLFDHEGILAAKRGYADLISGRGCPFRCTYCHNEPVRQSLRAAWGPFPAVRKRPVAELVEELEEYRERYGRHIRVFSFTDDVFPAGRQWTREFLEAYSARFSIPLVYCAAPSQVSAELAEWSARANTYMVRIGVESGSERVRRRVLGRPFSDEIIASAVSVLQSRGVNVLAFFMLALPGETEKEVFETFRAAAALRPDALQFSVFWPYPGTTLHDQVVAEGLFDPRGQYRGNYLSDSPLAWPEDRRRLYARVRQLTVPAVNSFMHPKAGFGELLRRGLGMSEAEWEAGGREEVVAAAQARVLDLLADGVSVYAAPFQDRPDVLLLVGRSRARPLLNLPAEYRT